MARLLTEGVPAFGLFVQSETEESARGADGSRLPPRYTPEGARRLAQNGSVDFLFLNLENVYDPTAVGVFVHAIREVGARAPALLVRIPPIATAGAPLTEARVREVLAMGANGIVMPHVRGASEVRAIATFFSDAQADVWTPANPSGDVVLLVMIEDSEALAAAAEIANTPGFSVLAVGIGSLTRSLGGDASAAEEAKLEVLRHANRAGLPDMTIATSEDVAQRVAEGFRMLLLNGRGAEQGVNIGRAAAGR